MCHGNDWLYDFNADDIWDQKKSYNNRHPYYIFLNGKWEPFAKDEFCRPRIVTMKSGNKYFFNDDEGIWQNLEKNNVEYKKIKAKYIRNKE